MSEELAQDEDGQFDLEAIRPDGPGGLSEEHLPMGGREPLRHEEVVFEIGDDDEDDGGRRRGTGEREGLMSGDGRVKDRSD